MRNSAVHLLIFLFLSYSKQTIAQPLPSKAQLAWHKMEFYLFVHFGPNTFTDKEWGEGTEPEDIFNPTNLDCRQWCRIAKAAGAKGIIITAKHHDGFCLWPSKYSTHTVRESKWKNGKGDVLKELSQACKEYGLKFGVYVSPWDRNHPKYGTAAYNDVFVKMMKEIFTSYGPVWELWWDGANGEGTNGKRQVYDWKRFETTVRKLSPNTVIFSDIGPDIRWCGNEQGFVGETNWNFLDTAGFGRGIGAPPIDSLNRGNYNGKNWIPAECDVSIRPGWFYHSNQDDEVKSSEQLFSIYLKSVGRGANLLLNVPPDTRGLIAKNDSVALIRFKDLRDRNFKSDLIVSSDLDVWFDQPGAGVFSNEKLNTLRITDFIDNPVSFNFKNPIELNCIVVGENTQLGQNIRRFQILDGKKNSPLVTGTSIGQKRIITFPRIKTSSIVIRVLEGTSNIELNDIRFYLIDEKFVESNK
jgi:alpha-L-fucosidase